MVVRLPKNVFKGVQGARETCHKEISAVAKISDSLRYIRELALRVGYNNMSGNSRDSTGSNNRKNRNLANFGGTPHLSLDSVDSVDQTVGAIA